MPFDKLFFCFLPLTESRFIISERGSLNLNIFAFSTTNLKKFLENSWKNFIPPIITNKLTMQQNNAC